MIATVNEIRTRIYRTSSKTFSFEYILRQSILQGKRFLFMEKTLSPDERIKRAEEIYYRKKMQNVNRSSARVNVANKKEFSLFKKMILQIAICITIYAIFYMIQNTNYIFSEDVIKKTNEILSYDINIKQLYDQGKDYINGFMNNVGADASVHPQQTGNSSETDTNNVSTEDLVLPKEEQENNIQEENIGGDAATEEKNEDTNLSQMEIDAKEILASKSLIIPLKGTITSWFGLRNPETPTVPKNHTGIDIAVNEGTVFIASMSGVVEEVSSERRLGKSYKNCK